MFTVPAQLSSQQQPTDSHGVVPDTSQRPSFPLGAHVLSLGRYLVNLSDGGGEQHHPCVDLSTGRKLTCRSYPLAEFHKKAHLLLAEYEGVCKPLEVCVVQDKAFVISRKTFGDLHNFLKQRKRLPEARAAPIFCQIVCLVRDAHCRNIALRDLKLKKFVFADHQRYGKMLSLQWEACTLSFGYGDVIAMFTCIETPYM